MPERNRVNPSGPAQRQGLRLLGFLCTAAGAILTAVGLVSFFSAFGGGGVPEYFWCAMVGLPLLGVGIAMLKFAYLGAITRYMVGETTPVAGDAIDDLVSRTSGSVKTLAGAVADGLREGAGSGEQVACRGCGAQNDAGAQFCDQCGQPLEAQVICGTCARANDHDARFCDGCGAALTN
jgi:hypothetical protein